MQELSASSRVGYLCKRFTDLSRLIERKVKMWKREMITLRLAISCRTLWHIGVAGVGETKGAIFHYHVFMLYKEIIILCASIDY